MQERTIDILKNFATINQGLVFKKGKRLRTISVQKNVFAVTEIPDEIPRDFAIYNLNEFLATISLFPNPKIDFKEDHVLIQSDRSKVKYFYSSPAVVVSPPDSDIKMSNPLLTFTLTEANLIQIHKASAALKLKELDVSFGKMVALNAATGSSGNQIIIETETEGEEDAPTQRVQIENLKMIQGSYVVQVFEKALRFENVASPDLVYFVTVEAKK